MDFAEFDNLLELTAQMIRICEPRKAEYWRGYRRGVAYHCWGKIEESPGDHDYFMDLATRSSCDAYMDAYARGYRDGCNGDKPGHTPLSDSNGGPDPKR